jgi:multidrug efflux pump subunit AcrA (membrane-fusion protein)
MLARRSMPTPKQCAGILIFAATCVHAAVEKKAPVVFVQTLKTAELYDSLSYPARVVSKQSASVLSEVDGMVAEVSVRLGEPVKAGRKILILKHTDPVYRYAPVIVRSPIAGNISLIEVNPGSQVARGQKLITITDPSHSRVLIELPAADLMAVQYGMKGEFKSHTDTIEMKVVGVSPTIDPTTGTATCELEPVHATATLSQGYLGQVSFKANIRKGLTVPDHAIVYRGNEIFLRVVREGRSHLTAVKLGKRQRGSTEIMSGIADGDVIIESASKHVSDGDEVTIEGAKKAEGEKT